MKNQRVDNGVMTAPPTIPLRLGIDLGGTKIELAILDTHNNSCYQVREPTAVQGYDSILAQITRMVATARHHIPGPFSIGIGTPGALDPDLHLIKNANSTCLNGQPLQNDLSRLLEQSVQIANDANCFALSEATDGAAAGAESVFGVILGTGVGAGLIIKGAMVKGVNAIAGEWGHNPLPYLGANETNNRVCYCGRTGCIETFLCGAGLVKTHQQHSGECKSTTQISRESTQGHLGCQHSLGLYCDQLARALASVINVMDPEVIVLGGGLSNIKLLYQLVPQYWSRYIFSSQIKTRLCAAKFGDASGVRGAAWLGHP